MAVTWWAFGIVRADVAGVRTDECVWEIRRWVPDHGFGLRGVECAHSDRSYPLLIATFAASGISAVVVPSLAHVTGWMDALQSEVTVWTIHPPHCWPHRPTVPSVPGRLPLFGGESEGSWNAT